MRIKIANLALIFGFAFLLLGLLNLQVIQGTKFKKLSDKNSVRLLTQAGSRGKIFDRHGQVIVDNCLTYDLMVSFTGRSQIDAALADIARILEVSGRDIKDTFRRNMIAPFIPVTIAENIDIKKAIALEELKLDYPGIVISPHPVRHYPYGRLAAHVIGYLSEIDRWRLTKLADYGYKTKDLVGFGGIEEKYDYYLRQEDGAVFVEVDHQGRFMRILGFKPPRNGKDIELTIDLKIQKIAEASLVDRKGCVVVMDPQQGEILAMASSPNFNPSLFINKAEPDSLYGLFNNPQAPLMNRASSGLYPAGSVFKLVVAAGGLETGKINLATSFNCTGATYVGKKEFSCWNTHGQQNLLEAITHSCNVFFYKTGLLLGGQILHDYALHFGFSKPTGIDLPYEAGGLVPSPLWRKICRFKNWFDGDTANFSIGQGDLLVTPLQISRMMAVFANRGMLVTPYLVKAVDNKDISVHQRKISKVALKETTINYIRNATRNVVASPTGTARVLADLPTSVAGKTGTAQVSSGQSHAWFVGFFPFNQPKYVICVFLEHGGAGQASCILAKQIIEAMLNQGFI